MVTVFPPGKGQLLYARSKVYIHQDTSKRNNVPGWLVLVKPTQDATSLDYIVAFIPESDVASPQDKQALNEFELIGLDGPDRGLLGPASGTSTPVRYDSVDSTVGSGDNKPKIKRFIERPRTSSLASFAFGLPLRMLYSVQVRPSTSGSYFGSICLFPKDSVEKLPILFFHDSESKGFAKESKMRSRKVMPFADYQVGPSTTMYWGGDRFISVLKNYCVVEPSTLEKKLVLINPTPEDRINFMPSVLEDRNKDGELTMKEIGENINEIVTSTKWKVLTGLASITNFAKDTVNNVIESNRLPQPIRNVLKKPEVKRIGDEFDSANIYLAKWALAVQEEAEKSRRVLIGNTYYNDLIKSELGDNFIELTPQEVSKATRQKPITKVEWDSFFDHSGRLQITVDEVKERIFHGGLTNEVRIEGWLYLLRVFPWDSSKYERDQMVGTLAEEYAEYKTSWIVDAERQANDEFWKDQKIRIYKDVKRTDRDLDIFKGNGDKNQTDEDENDDDDDAEDAEIKNPHLVVLKDILFSYNELNYNLGYVQGMSDLLSPVYYILRDETLSFWSFAGFMEIMERNFVKDLSGMKSQMLALNELVQFMLPDLYVHLEKSDSNNLFFFFRMLLVWFKRELSFDDTLKLWEVLWTNLRSSQFVLFFALAILEKHSKIMINNLKEFDQILKYMNDLSGTLDVDDLLVRAELLFLKFKQMVELIDRKNDRVGFNQVNNQEQQKIVISDDLRLLLSKEIIIQKEEERTQDTPFG